MKKHIQKKYTLRLLLFILSFVFNLCLQAVCSTATADLAVCQANLISAEIRDVSPDGVMLVSRNIDFPVYRDNLPSDVIGYDFNFYYGRDQKTFYSSTPEDGFSPFKIFYDSQTSSSVPFLSLPVYGGNVKSSVAFFSETLFSNETESSLMDDHEIYITQDAANVVLNSSNPTDEEYRSLIGKKMICRITKDGLSTADHFTILDIMSKPSYQYLTPFFGRFFVVGGYSASSHAVIDGFEIDTLMNDDFYANQHFLRAYIKIVEEKYHYVSTFRSFPKGSRSRNDIVEHSSLLFSRCLASRATTIFFVALFFFLILIFWRTHYAPRRLISSGVNGSRTLIILFSFSFALASFVCSFLRSRIVAGVLPCLSSPFGVVFSFAIVTVLYLSLLYLSPKHQRDEKSQRN